LHNRFSGLIVILFCAVAWLGVRNLEYVEFTLASRMFLGGKFRRIIDAETRLVGFETSLAKAADLEECWRRIRAGSTEFGFQGVRMSMNGMVYEVVDSSESRRLWQLRIPLEGGQYVNFFRDFLSEMNPLILSAFVGAVEKGLKAWMAARQDELARMPVAAAPRLYYTANASATNASVITPGS